MTDINSESWIDIAQRGFENWKSKPHNARWFRKIDGTPIPNDLTICIGEAFAAALAAEKRAKEEAERERDEAEALLNANEAAECDEIKAAEAAAAALARALEEAERERDSWKAVCRKAGVCMSCAIAMPDPHGCFDCLNTGWEGGAPKGSAPEKIVTPLHSDGEPLSMEGAIAANRPCATHCTVCEGEEHHWLDECADEGDPIQVCKHCNAWRPFGDDADD